MMPNEIRRPCTHEAFNHNEPFEAIGAVVSIVEGGISNGVQQFAVKLDLVEGYSEDLDFESRGMAYYTYQSVLLAIAEALNAPVKATEEVLEGLPNDAKIWKVSEDSLELCFISWYNKKWVFYVVDAHSTMTGGGCEVELEEKKICSTDWIKSNRCPKTAEYLRNFYTNGVRINK